MAYNFSPSSPALLAPAAAPTQQLDHYFASTHYAHGGAAAGTTNGHSSNSLRAPFLPSEPLPTTPGSLAGRKRSRGDVNAPEEEEDEDDLDDGSTELSESERSGELHESQASGSESEVVHHDDMGRSIVVESQTSTWVEERAHRNQFQLSHIKRPSISTRKSRRMDANASSSDDLSQLVPPPLMREATTEPLIDEATRALGISWTRMDSSEYLKISRAAYSKWIQNHYACLKDVDIWFENSAIPAYIVAATNVDTGKQHYYIFHIELIEGRLITRDPTQLVSKLKLLPNLHLVAPGSIIRAEKEPITNRQKQENGVQAEMVNVNTAVDKPEDICTAQSMEID